MRPALLSVVIPSYNEAKRLPATLARVQSYLAGASIPHEILVVDDGSVDSTAEEAVRAGGSTLRVLKNEKNQGKGYSVRRGMLAATGSHRLMTDADLSTPMEDLERLLGALEAGSDIAIASRALPLSRIEVRQSAYRESMGRVFNRLVRLLALPDLMDTQCGFKLFTAKAAETAFSLARLKGFSFDVEVLYIARRHGLKIAEVPVTWRNDDATRVSPLGGAQAFSDLLKIRMNDAWGFYRMKDR